MNRLRAYGAAVAAASFLVLAGCGSDVDGSATAPLATVDTDPPSVVRTTPATPPSPMTSAAPTTTASTTPAKSTTSSPPPTADPSQYESTAGFFYFTSPSGKFECAIVVTETSIAGCHGEFPRSVPRVAGSGAPESSVAPNTVEITAGSPARFLSSGDPRFHRFDGPAKQLPYGLTLAIPGSGRSNGLECRVEESSGVTCLDQVGHGFTVSDKVFELK
ncbi:hypothetical protein E5720_15450 [Rhodococcus sp. PAMC28707]|uniref:hypothetical protein n=1 Tax=unclassified Rhodococcus (in: high G+C Gram-positive bacteria) TaxID=192944 RepID=UPI00109DAB3C|nr:MULTISPECIES: hypothetical protein [unclassified Rhodococcus (in: high G+C Gram-positive bacteria)]QCB52148.1 hypothetical protein E5769_20070 [Rhodococcus sp. PAMC28705]QCB59683.1 hypothetical protein E5720_15450 [Rhodococcus sp. PAMC28707]